VLIDILRVEFAFELATTKNAGRVFLFAASTADDRRVWMSKLGMVLIRSLFCLLQFLLVSSQSFLVMVNRGKVAIV